MEETLSWYGENQKLNGYTTLVGEENETPFIRMWKPFTSRCVLKTLR